MIPDFAISIERIRLRKSKNRVAAFDRDHGPVARPECKCHGHTRPSNLEIGPLAADWISLSDPGPLVWDDFQGHRCRVGPAKYQHGYLLGHVGRAALGLKLHDPYDRHLDAVCEHYRQLDQHPPDSTISFKCALWKSKHRRGPVCAPFPA